MLGTQSVALAILDDVISSKVRGAETRAQSLIPRVRQSLGPWPTTRQFQSLHGGSSPKGSWRYCSISLVLTCPEGGAVWFVDGAVARGNSLVSKGERRRFVCRGFQGYTII